MAKKEKDERGLSMQDLRSAMAEEHPDRDAGLSAAMAMSSDTIEEQQPDGTYRFALNGVMEDRETTGRLQNEESNEECIDITSDIPTEYNVILETCCGDVFQFASTSISELKDFVEKMTDACSGFTFTGFSVDGNVFATVGELTEYIMASGFGEYRIVTEGCDVVKHKLTIFDCCSGTHITEYEEGTVVHFTFNGITFECGMVPFQYSISSGGSVVEDNIPYGAVRDIVMDDDVDIVVDCYEHGKECDIFHDYRNIFDYYNDGNPNYAGIQTFDGIDYVSYYPCDNLYVCFEVVPHLAGYVGTSISQVRVSGNQIATRVYDIYMAYGNNYHGNAVCVTRQGHTYIVVYVGSIGMYEQVFIDIGNLTHENPEDDCYERIAVKSVDFVIVGEKSFIPATTIVDVASTQFGFTDAEGNEAKGIAGNYDGGRQITGFVVSDGFGNSYVSKTNDMEINIYHNRKIELIYGKG